jgi:hypothetical protein
MSISMPVGLFETFSIKSGRKRLAWLEKEKRVISAPEQLLKCWTAAAASTYTREATVDASWIWCRQFKRIDHRNCGFG